MTVLKIFERLFRIKSIYNHNAHMGAYISMNWINKHIWSSSPSFDYVLKLKKRLTSRRSEVGAGPSRLASYKDLTDFPSSRTTFRTAGIVGRKGVIEKGQGYSGVLQG